MTMGTTYAGMDAHARTIHVAVLRPGAKGPEEWQLANEPRAVKRLARRLRRAAGGPVLACYEAGPTGFALRFEHPAAQATFDDHLRALEGVEERLRTLERELALCAESED